MDVTNLFLERINAMDSLLKYNNACSFYKLNNQYLNIGIFNQVDTYKKQLEDDGFVIVRNLVDLNLISEIKSFWVIILQIILVFLIIYVLEKKLH